MDMFSFPCCTFWWPYIKISRFVYSFDFSDAKCNLVKIYCQIVVLSLYTGFVLSLNNLNCCSFVYL